ncbi:hypothetical protein BH24ACT26_BH24ACT26_07010 [soil metagenome]
MIARGEIRDAATVAALYLFDHRGKIEQATSA